MTTMHSTHIHALLLVNANLSVHHMFSWVAQRLKL